MVERSPRALRADPPAIKVELVLDRAVSHAELLALVQERGGWDDATQARLVAHAGLHVDRVRVEPERPPARVEAGARVVAYALSAEPELPGLGPERMLLDEAGVVAVDKPPFLTVQGTRATRRSSLERLLRERLGCPALTPIHRLDRETSGVLLFARDPAAARRAGKQFSARTVTKEYVAVVSPPPSATAWQVTGRLARVAHPAHSLFELRQGGPEAGEWSGTRFEVQRAAGARALVRALPLTGRTHQLRVHLASGGTPIVGDALYGAGWAEGGAERMLLHALALELALEEGGPPRRIEAPLPGDLRGALD